MKRSEQFILAAGSLLLAGFAAALSAGILNVF